MSEDKISTLRLSQDQITGNIIEPEGLEDYMDCAFLRISLTDDPSVLAVAQKYNRVAEDGIVSSLVRIVYRSDKDSYPVFYYAVGRFDVPLSDVFAASSYRVV